MKRLISALLAIFTVAALICVPVVATEATETFWVDQVPANHTLQGSGTKADPYLITSAIDLAYIGVAISSDVYLAEKTFAEHQFQGKYFLQTADIDLSAHTWIPIGGVKINRHLTDGSTNNPASNFIGNYDGNFHSITGMKVTDNSFKYNLQTKTLGTSTNVVGTVQTGSGAGLFGRFGNNNTTNLQTLSNLAVTGTINLSSVAVTRVGGIVAYVNTPFQFENLYSNVSINTTTANAAAYIGGIFGQNDKTGVNENCLINCVAEGDITANTSSTSVDFMVGGFFGKWIGADYNKVLTNCYYTGDISVTQTALRASGNFRIGGLWGQLGDAINKVNNVHMYGTVAVTCGVEGTNAGNYHIGLVGSYWKVSGGFEGANNSYVDATGTATMIAAWNAGTNQAAAEGSFTKLATAGTVPFVGTTKFLTAPKAVVLRFAQERVNGDTMDVRFLGTGVAGTVSGFKVTATLSVPSAEEGGEPTVTNGTPNVDIPVTVYNTIDADGKTGITAANLGGKATDKIIGCVITGVPTTGTVTFEITPYVDATEGATMTIVYTDGVYKSCTIAD